MNQKKKVIEKFARAVNALSDHEAATLHEGFNDLGAFVNLKELKEGSGNGRKKQPS